MSVDGFRNPLTPTIINVTILSIFTVFRFLSTRDLTTHYVFQVEVKMDWCITWSANYIVSSSLLHCNAHFFKKAFKYYTSIESLLYKIIRVSKVRYCTLRYTVIYSYLVYFAKESINSMASLHKTTKHHGQRWGEDPVTAAPKTHGAEKTEFRDSTYWQTFPHKWQ